MFTGLIETTGTITAVRPAGNGVELCVQSDLPLAEVDLGASIAVDGACLTVETTDGGTFTCTAGRETLALTTLGAVHPGRAVHLERALRLGDRLGGHLVQGHVDGVGTVVRASKQRESTVLWIELPRELTRYVAAKGSVCVDGVSLTVNEIDGPRFRVNIIPHTVSITRMGSLKPGDTVNLEVDILAKYVERMLSGDASEGLTLDQLRESGF